MSIRLLAALLIITSQALIPVQTHSAEAPASHQAIELSPDLLNLLRAEMREIATGVQGIAVSLASADWKSIQQTSEAIRASYIMNKKLTAAQATELGHALPGHFKQLDAEFHQRAEKLGMAAASHDSELVAFHYSRLIDNCVACHSVYAQSRFPGFSVPDRQGHHH